MSQNLSEVVKQIQEKMENLTNRINKKLYGIWNMEYHPFLMGDSFVVIHSWEVDDFKLDGRYAGKKVILVDPGISFGSSHSTTNLMIKGLEKYWEKRGRLLDVGTGTGILSIVATVLSENAIIDAFDISENVIFETRRTVKLNNLTDRINIKLGKIQDYSSKNYDMVLANLLPEIHENIGTQIVDKVKEGGILIVSGFPTTERGSGGAYFDWTPTLTKGADARAMTTLYEKMGLSLLEHLCLDEDSALVFKK